MSLLHGRHRQRTALWLCVMCAACTLLATTCDLSNGGGVSLVAPAPVDAALSVVVSQHSGLTALRARDGSTRWTQGLGDAGVGRPELLDVYYTAGLFIVWAYDRDRPDHLTLVAVDASDGRVRSDGLSAPGMAIARDYLVLQLGTQTDPGPLRVVRLRDGVTVRDIPLSAGGQLAAGEDGTGGGDVAYVCTYDAVITAFHLDDGRTLWTSPVVQGLPPGAGCSLQALDGMVLGQVTLPAASGNLVPTIVARRAGDGRVLWQEPRGLGINRGGVEYYLDRATLEVVAYRTVDGAVLWRTPGGSAYLAGDEDVIAFAQNQRGQGESLEAVDAADGAVVWRYPHPADRALSISAVGGGLVLAESSGTWSIHHPAPPGTDTRTYLLALGARDGRLYWQMPLDLFSLAVGESA